MGQIYKVWGTEFHGIECLTDGEELGFEGYYNNDLNHPDPRPGHAIWIKKMDAEKLFMIFRNASSTKEEIDGQVYPNAPKYRCVGCGKIHQDNDYNKEDGDVLLSTKSGNTQFEIKAQLNDLENEYIRRSNVKNTESEGGKNV